MLLVYFVAMYFDNVYPGAELFEEYSLADDALVLTVWLNWLGVDDLENWLSFAFCTF